MFKSINPYNLELIAEYPLETTKEVEAKLGKAHSAFLSRKFFSFTQRSEVLLKLSEILQDNPRPYAEIITKEMGKILPEALAEVKKCASVCEYYARHGEWFLKTRELNQITGKAMVRFDPLGVILGIMPWNFPFWQAFRFVIPTIMAGNSTLLKHAPNVTGSAFAIRELLLQAGVPDGVFEVIMINEKQIAQLIGDPLIRAVTLTGSEQAGMAVAATAGKHLKKTVLELGGSDPFIVLEDANIEQAVEVGIKSRMLNCGQSCIAAKRFILHQKIAADFMDAFEDKIKALKVGNPQEDGVNCGPLARTDLKENLNRQVEDSVKMGAELVGGVLPDDLGKGSFFQPGFLRGIKSEMPAWREELFGPVALMFTVKDDDEAISLANDTRFGLGASIWTQDVKKALEMVNRIDSGSVFINKMVASAPGLPFGGVKSSGYGRELSDFGIMEFVNVKTVVVA